MRQFVLACAIFASVPTMVAFNSTGDEFQNQEGDEWSPEVIKIYEESEVADLEEAGVQILRRRGDILLCLVPNVPDTRATRHAASLRERFKYRRGRFNQPTLDRAVKWYGADRIFFDEVMGYTGRGVVVGLCDIGLDPTHPTFLDSEGRSRIAQITQYKEAEGARIVLSGDDAYLDWVTDDRENYHATHVAGILAGNGGLSLPEGPWAYKGVARDAEIVASVSQLSDVGLLCGVEDIIDYAKSVGRPAVINLSMGNYVGPHDGTSLFSQYLDMCAEDAIIVLSAGNEGNSTCSLPYTFTGDDDTVGFRIGNTAWDQRHIYGMTDIWSEDDRALAIALGVYDDQTRQVTPLIQLQLPESGETVFIDNSDSVFGEHFDGWIAFAGGIDEENGRYNLQVVYDYNAEELVSGGWARYTMAVTVGGTTGQGVDIFGDAQFTRLMTLSGNPIPGSEFSISDLACGRNIISVGMYNNQEMESAAGTFSIHSSYGTLRDGRILPLTSAPGTPIISAASRPYVESHDVNANLYMATGGTSMSAPYVAGFIATMLEAFPELTVAQVQEAIAATNHLDDIPYPEDMHNGEGFFDPYEAMMYLFDKASAEGGVTDDSGVRIVVRNGMVEVLNPTGRVLPVEVYSTTGMLLNRLEVESGATTLQLPKGLWVVKAATDRRLVRI